MPVQNGLHVLRELVGTHDSPVIFVTAQRACTAVEAMRLGAIMMWSKAGGMDYFQLLPSVINRVIERHAKEIQRLATWERSKNIIGI